MRFCLFAVMILVLTGNEEASDELPNAFMSKKLFDFNTNDEASWQIVNDGVMGGRSKGYFTIEEGMLRFTGTLVTQGGGFTSVRINQSFNLEGYDGLELRVRGDGRTFEVAVGDDTRRRGRTVSRRASFETRTEWTLVRVPFDSFRTTVFGQPVNAPAIDPANVKRIGLFIVDGIDGPFRLEVDEISAYRDKSG